MDDLFGTEEFSNDKTFCVVFADGFSESDKWTKGTVGLLKNGKQVFTKKFDRPHDCKVSNNGTVIICDWGNTDKLAGDFIVLDEKGNEIFIRVVKANIGTCTISNDGHYSIFETYSSDTEDSNKIFVIDIKNKSEINSFERQFAFIKADIDTTQKQITLIDNSNFEFITDFNGNQLNKKELEESILNKGTILDKLIFLEGNYLINELFNRSDYEGLLIKALSDNDACYSYGQAKLYKVLGQLYLERNEIEKTIDSWGKALEINPKVGVKKKYDKLVGKK